MGGFSGSTGIMALAERFIYRSIWGDKLAFAGQWRHSEGKREIPFAASNREVLGGVFNLAPSMEKESLYELDD